MKFTETLSHSLGMAAGTAASYGVGFLYGAAWGLNKTATAKAFAINVAAILIFRILVNLITGGKVKNPKQYYRCHVIAGTILAGIQIIALRQLNIIGRLGTAFLGFNAFILTLIHLHGYYNKS